MKIKGDTVKDNKRLLSGRLYNFRRIGWQIFVLFKCRLFVIFMYELTVWNKEEKGAEEVARKRSKLCQ